ncbi:MAG TPA: hypothetical protein LFW20_03925 [Rickettsia endosymbiont of Omalisus fontisbellaquei]|nr:hypothetical protein [Rickettsia endosymbiont of Omalisus fontisbellaquei]
MLLDKFIMIIPKEIKTALVKIKNYFSFSKKVTKDFEVSNISIDEVDKAEPAKITREDLEKSFELYEEKLAILAQKLSSQTSISNYDYNHQTEYYPLIGEGGSIQYIPTTEL